MLVERGDHVLATCIAGNAELRALGVQVVEGIDVSSEECFASLQTVLEAAPPLDMLISNAGVNEGSGGFADADTSAMAREYEVNVLGAVRVVRTALPFLSAGARIAFITTGRGALVSTPTPAAGANYGYRMSKAALNLYAGLLAADLEPRGIRVALLHPGVIDTELLRHATGAGAAALPAVRAAPPDEVAPVLLGRIDKVSAEFSGKWIGLDGRLVS